MVSDRVTDGLLPEITASRTINSMNYWGNIVNINGLYPIFKPESIPEAADPDDFEVLDAAIARMQQRLMDVDPYYLLTAFKQALKTGEADALGAS